MSASLDAGRHDAHVRLDHLHHHADRRPRSRPPPLVRAVALPGPARRHGRAGDQRHADPLVPRAASRASSPEAVAIAMLAAEAECSPPGAKGLVVLPYFSGERTPIHDPHAKGLIFGLNLTHDRGDHLSRPSRRHRLRHAARLRDLFGGGPGAARRSMPSAAARRTVCGRRQPPTSWASTQIVRAKTVGASYGDAFLAALAVGDVGAQDIATWNPLATEIKADTANRNVYDERYRIFRYLYPATRQLIDARQLRPN